MLLILSAGVIAVCVITCGMAYGILRALNITQQRTRWASWAGATLSLVAALSLVGCDLIGGGSGGGGTGEAGPPYGGAHKRAGVVIASRGFAGPTQYPPEDFAAYGILAF